MAPRENGLRMLSASARDKGRRITYRDALNGTIGEEEFRVLLDAARDIDPLPVQFIEPSLAELRRLTDEIRRHARRFQRQGREVLVVIDYLQKIVVSDTRRHTSAPARPARMKRLAMHLRVPFLVLAQLSRGVESRDNKRPVLSDLRDSGEIEQDANTAMFLYRDEYYLERAIEADPDGDTATLRVALDRARNQLEIIVAKQPSGPLKTVRVGFCGATKSLWELGEIVAFPGLPARTEGVDL